MPLTHKEPATRSTVGCGYIAAQGTLLCLLLILNGFVVRSTIRFDWVEEVRISQAIQLVLPVLMLFAELWLYDLIFAAKTLRKN